VVAERSEVPTLYREGNREFDAGEKEEGGGRRNARGREGHPRRSLSFQETVASLQKKGKDRLPEGGKEGEGDPHPLQGRRKKPLRARKKPLHCH